jgi:excisionase family DNA binding protein
MSNTNITTITDAERCIKNVSRTERGLNTPPQLLDVLQLPDALLKMQTVVQATGLSAATIYRKVSAGELKLIKMGARCTRFHAADVRAFIQAQTSYSTAPTAAQA